MTNEKQPLGETVGAWQFKLGTLVTWCVFACMGVAIVSIHLRYQARFDELNAQIQRLERHAQLADELYRLRAELIAIEQKYSDVHPKHRSVSAQVRQLEKLIEESKVELGGREYRAVPMGKAP